MKATMSGLSAVLCTLVLAAAAQAWHGYCPPPANAFSPSCCCPCWDGGFGGTCGGWPPYCQPFQGFQGQPPGCTGAGAGIYSFARSPRDYFMVDP